MNSKWSEQEREKANIDGGIIATEISKQEPMPALSLLKETAIELACQRNALREALKKAEIGLMLCNPLPGYDMQTLHIVRAALLKSQPTEKES